MDGYDEFLEQIRRGEHPDYGEMSWDGEHRQTVISVKFERPGRPEAVAAVRERAWRYLRQLTPAERAMVRIRILCRDEKPVGAVIEPRRGGLSLAAGRLRQLSRVLQER